MVTMLRTGIRYFTNLVARVADQRGYLAGISIGGRFIINEAASLIRFFNLTIFKNTLSRQTKRSHRPASPSKTILAALSNLEGEMITYQIDVDAFHKHVAACNYPSNYAAGPVNAGGAREHKLLEYFVSLDLLDIRPADVVVDVASEWSLFPDVLRKLTRAKVYRQDIIYPPGINDDHIGGDAAHMPVPDEFADKLVLHNAFEHFEGTSDTDFILESWRVLKPGGKLCILPLFMAEQHRILTDPLVNRRSIIWDDGALVIEVPWWHNRFGRFYDAGTLEQRVLAPGNQFRSIIFQIVNVKEIHPKAYLYFALVMQKPLEA
jgi:SAM-dependent methyltransferase